MPPTKSSPLSHIGLCRGGCAHVWKAEGTGQETTHTPAWSEPEPPACRPCPLGKQVADYQPHPHFFLVTVSTQRGILRNIFLLFRSSAYVTWKPHFLKPTECKAKRTSPSHL